MTSVSAGHIRPNSKGQKSLTLKQRALIERLKPNFTLLKHQSSFLCLVYALYIINLDSWISVELPKPVPILSPDLH